ncbi:MAG: STM4013/SEN3800 family hydrolase [Gemmataceae bacterium]
MLDLNAVVGRADVLFVTFDCLRYDVAVAAPTTHLPPWERRETPGTFTLPAHLAFFHGFLPTPVMPGLHPRLFAMEFEGSLSTAPTTYVFRGVPDVVSGFAALGYRTFCVGGVGFFNKLNPLGRVLPGFFQESVWSPALGVAARDSTAHQVAAAIEWLRGVPRTTRVFLFVNVSATHPPHAHYSGASAECVGSQAAALCYADAQLPPLLDALRRRGECLCLMMGDHGEAYGEDGRFGHRLAHPVVTTVPYAHFLLR